MCVILLLAGCIQQEDAKDAAANQKAREQDSVQRGGVYRYPLMNNPSTLDPVYLQDQYGAPVVRQLFEGLVQFGPYLTVLPALAETWQVDNAGRTYRFFLRTDARFHNGHPVTAEDAIFSIRRLLRVNPAPAILPQLLKIEGAPAYRDQQNDAVRGLKRINDHEFTVTLIEPHVPFLTALGMYQAAIVPQLEVENNEKKFGRAPVGSGPFRFVSWTTDDSIELDRFVPITMPVMHIWIRSCTEFIQAYKLTVHYQIFEPVGWKKCRCTEIFVRHSQKDKTISGFIDLPLACNFTGSEAITPS